jgi:hypothetical protein
MSSPYTLSPIRLAFLASGLAFATVAASAQSSSQPVQPGPGESSSSSYQFADDSLSGAAALRSAVDSLGADGGGGAAAGQDYGSHHDYLHHLAWEFSGGANAPLGNSSNYITWGGNFAVGGGLHLDKANRFSLLAEYEFLDNKLPGNLIAETGANGGHAHIWSLTLAPVVDLFPKRTNSVFVTGGGGFYRKVTSFTDPNEEEYCDYYYCGIETVNEVVGHFSSNQGGWNVGGGFSHRVGGLSGDGQMKLFAEVRYLDVMTPAVVSNPNGLSTTSLASGTRLLPMTVGLRW